MRQQTGFSLIEVMIACAVGTIYIVIGYAWYISVSQSVDRDIQTMELFSELRTTIAQYTKYEDIAAKDPDILVLDKATTTVTTTFTDIDRTTSRVRIEVATKDNLNTVHGEKIFSKYSTSQNSPWCSIFLNDIKTFSLRETLIIPGANLTSIIQYGKYLIASNDTALLSDSDLYVIDTEPTMHIIASLTTGPGISNLLGAGRYVYAANTSINSQVQTVDMFPPTKPQVINDLKIALPTPTTTSPKPSALAFDNNILYLGTEKWNGSELILVNVANPIVPTELSGAETSSMVQDITLDGDSMYVGLSADPQFAEYKVQDSVFNRIWGYAPSGWQTQEGKRVVVLPKYVFFGRTVGGFNSLINHELFVMNRNGSMALATSTDIGDGVYGLIASGKKILTAIGGTLSYLGITNNFTKSLRPDIIIPLLEKPKSMLCAGDTVVVLSAHSVYIYSQ